MGFFKFLSLFLFLVLFSVNLNAVVLSVNETNILHANDAQVDDIFGSRSSMDGSYFVIAAFNEDGGSGDPLLNSGAVYVYEHNSSNSSDWDEISILRASDAQTNDYFGTSVSINGLYVVVGAEGEDGGSGDPLSASGAVYVYERNSSNSSDWDEISILRASDAQASDYFGNTVNIDGDYVVVGAILEDGGLGDPLSNSGAVYIYERNSSNSSDWDEISILRASDARASDNFGRSVSISGSYLVVGANGEDGGPGDPLSGSGAVYIYERNSSNSSDWNEISILHASDAQANDNFGNIVDLDDSYLVIGAYLEDGGLGDPLSNSGAVYIYERNSSNSSDWNEISILRASDAQVSDAFGRTVSISGSYFVIGADQEDGGSGDPLSDSGAVYTFNILEEITVLSNSFSSLFPVFGLFSFVMFLGILVFGFGFSKKK